MNALGLEEGWDSEIGLETEIVPLTRPYGLWTGNVFTGMVKDPNGKNKPIEIGAVYWVRTRDMK